MQNSGFNTTFVEQPTNYSPLSDFTDSNSPFSNFTTLQPFLFKETDHSRSTEFPLPNLTDSNSPFSNFTTLQPFLSEETAVKYEGVPTFNSTIPELLDTDTAIYIYTAFILGSVFITSIRSIFFFKVCMTASKILHDTMFGCILAATMRFFDTNPSGKSIIIMHYHMVYISYAIDFM
jgi:hypothetical protein